MSRPRTSPRLALLAVAIMLATTAAIGCGPQVDAPPAAAPVATPPELAQLTLQIRDTGGDQVNERVRTALETALVRSNYRLAPDGVKPDVVLEPRAVWQREASVWRFERNGHELFKMQVHVAVAVLAKGKLVERLAADFGATSEDPIDPAFLIPVLNGMARSEPLLALARAGSSGGNPADPQIALHDKPKPSKAEDDRDWASSGASACARATRLDACDKVRTYLARHPDGAHADDARRALADAEPALEKIRKDDDAWDRANADECRAQRTREACVGVGVYVNLFPNGIHAREAKQLVVY